MIKSGSTYQNFAPKSATKQKQKQKKEQQSKQQQQTFFPPFFPSNFGPTTTDVTNSCVRFFEQFENPASFWAAKKKNLGAQMTSRSKVAVCRLRRVDGSTGRVDPSGTGPSGGGLCRRWPQTASVCFAPVIWASQ